MTVETFLALLGFAFVTSVTPGPNNLMLMASGANYGFRRTIPHMLGVAIGFAVMASALAAGLAQVFARHPVAHDVLKVASVVYMGWLAWKIATAAAPGDGRATGRPMTFLEAAAFQWVNPKAWAMALTAVTVYAPPGAFLAAVFVAVAFAAVNLPSVGVWALAGVRLRRWLAKPGRLRAFNWIMAALLIASLAPILAA